MKYKVSYPYGGADKLLEPIQIEKSIGIDTGLTIQGHTWKHDGCQIILFDQDKKEISRHVHSTLEGPGYHCTMAEDIIHDIRMLGFSPPIMPQQLYGVMKTVRDKCESRRGEKLPGYDYEVLVVLMP